MTWVQSPTPFIHCPVILPKLHFLTSKVRVKMAPTSYVLWEFKALRVKHSEQWLVHNDCSSNASCYYWYYYMISVSAQCLLLSIFLLGWVTGEGKATGDCFHVPMKHTFNDITGFHFSQKSQLEHNQLFWKVVWVILTVSSATWSEALVSMVSLGMSYAAAT